MYEELLKHKPEGISKDIEAYVNDVVFAEAHYIFYKTKGKRQGAYCTKCKRGFTTNGLRHNEINECPYCYEKLKTKSINKGRRGLVHSATIIWYEKSKVDNYSVVARGFTVVRDYSEDIYEPGNSYIEQAFYLFTIKGCRMFKRNWWTNEWEPTQSIYRFNINSLANMPFYHSYENIEKTIENTCLKYSSYKEFRKQYLSMNAYEAYKSMDMLKYFEFYLKYPHIEKMIKMGLGNLVIDKLNGGVLGSTVNWRAQEVNKMLKITKGELREVVKNKLTLTPLFLKLYQVNSNEKQKLSISELKDLEYIVMYPGYIDWLKIILKYTTIKKFYKYVYKQYKTNKYKSMNLILSDWKDYIFDAKKLNIDLNIESNIMPKDLYITHQNTIKQIKYNNNLEIMRKAKARVKELQKYNYKANGLLIRGPKDSQEIIEEGKVQHICVGGYAERHADGKTTILFIRKVDNPNESFYTVEVSKDNEVVQVRGKRNCDPTPEVEEFIKMFKENKLKLNKKKNKVV